MNRPNILLIMTDQQSTGAMSCSCNDDIKTPAIDRLAQTGTRFGSAYCSFPLCTPSRGSIFTGLMPTELDIMGNDKPITQEFRHLEMGIIFSSVGYKCAYAGKWHVPEINMPKGHGFETLCGINDHEVTLKSVEFLKQKHDEPFLLVASFDNPHNICEWARDQVLPWGPVEYTRTEDCPDLPANFHIPPYEPQAIRYEMSKSPRAFSTPEYSDEDWWRRYRNAYFRLVEKVDAQVGKVLQALYDSGLEDNTLIMFTSDHGDGMGAHKWKQKWIMYEEAVHIPLIISFRGRIREGYVDEHHLISNGLDIIPTLCDYAGIDKCKMHKGMSVRRLAETGKDENWREHLISVTSFNDRKTDGRMVRSDRYKYIVYNWGRYREQLFDLKKDPGEMVNLAVNTKNKDVLSEHRRLLMEWCNETGDKFGEQKSYHPGIPVVPGYDFY